MADVTADQVSGRRAETHGEGGLLGKLTKIVIEGTLEGQMDDQLGYAKHARPAATARSPFGMHSLADTNPPQSGR